MIHSWHFLFRSVYVQNSEKSLTLSWWGGLATPSTKPHPPRPSTLTFGPKAVALLALSQLPRLCSGNDPLRYFSMLAGLRLLSHIISIAYIVFWTACILISFIISIFCVFCCQGLFCLQLFIWVTSHSVPSCTLDSVSSSYVLSALWCEDSCGDYRNCSLLHCVDIYALTAMTCAQFLTAFQSDAALARNCPLRAPDKHVPAMTPCVP